jgi:hypothetical protein
MEHFNIKEYIGTELIYTNDGRLLDGDLNVMMDWETPIMERSAEIICKNGGKILNIGFGLGIIDGFIQNHNIKEHHIIECHPSVLNRMRNLGWFDKENVFIYEGFWRDYIDDLVDFDGVYFDTWKESYFDLFIEKSSKVLRKNGILSFFNSGPIVPERHHLPERIYNNLIDNFYLDSEILELDYNGRNTTGYEKYWNKDRKTAPISICIRK